MSVATEQVITEKYAAYNADCCDVLAQARDASIHFSIYSPPFAHPGGGALYSYSSSARDLSNARSYDEFFGHYEFVAKHLLRMTMAGRMTAVHCMDVPTSNSGTDHMIDFPGDIIRMHERVGWRWAGRYCIWKEPLAVRNRTMAKNLAHKTIVDDSSRCSMASADQLLIFRKPGVNPVPITHPEGLMEYIGERQIPAELLRFRGWKGDQTQNRFSHWIWRQYASAFWDDIRLDRVLPYKPARDQEDEKHVHPLQLDVIERAVTLWTNPGEVVCTPFMGVGSEVYGAVRLGRKGLGVELKPSYFRQAVKNLEAAAIESEALVKQPSLVFDAPSSDSTEPDPFDDADPRGE